MKDLLIINGSASNHSANDKLITYLRSHHLNEFNVTLFTNLKLLPHFDPECSTDDPPKAIVELRTLIEKADGVLICSPEYIFSVPSGLKNALEWCVSTTVFQDKPLGIITASADGQKAHVELQLIMKTLSAHFKNETTLLIQGIKGKINAQSEVTSVSLKEELLTFVSALKELIP